ncbi:MAG: hypothetical protein IPK93_12440 [Solirubrobacterales bacterium]|nr:hypothetical protein [Solirubrobacterales bacterium]
MRLQMDAGENRGVAQRPMLASRRIMAFIAGFAIVAMFALVSDIGQATAKQ